MIEPIHDIPAVTFVGRGKLARAVAELWEERGGSIASMVGSNESWEAKGLVFEATTPGAAVANLSKCLKAGTPFVTGTTGWHDSMSDLAKLAQEHRATGFWSTNFSPGVHALNAIAQHASQVMTQLEGYTAHIREVHHVHKLDAPSGTAITLKQAAMTGGLSKETPIRSERQGEVVGLHALAWDSVHDSVVLQHEAKNRGGFAEGAVLALRWIWQQHLQGHHGLFTMTDLFKP